MMTRKSNRERVLSREAMESQKPAQVQPSVHAPDKPDLKDFGNKKMMP